MKLLSITDMIRADHSRVMVAFHRYSIQARPAAKRALAAKICLALETHAQAEEEIFYAELRKAGSTVEKDLAPEHEEMRRLIAALRATPPEEPQFDATFMELMRAVIHHVADEETIALPYAESQLAGRLRALGARFMQRRAGLLARRAPAQTAALGMGAALAGFFLLRRILR